jgi:hypothetical protein
LNYYTVVVAVNVDDKQIVVDVLDNDISLNYDDNVLMLDVDS